MGAKYPFYLLSDSKEGQQKEAELTRTAPSETPTYGNIRQGFVYERVPHITLKSIANNAEIDVIWDDYQSRLEPLREKLNQTLGTNWEEWEIPRNVEAASCRLPSDTKRLESAATLLTEFWEQRIARQKEIDASIAADPYKSLKTTLKAEINPEAWETLYSDTSRPFNKPKSGRIAVKVINHLGDEVMKVFRVS